MLDKHDKQLVVSGKKVNFSKIRYATAIVTPAGFFASFASTSRGRPTGVGGQSLFVESGRLVLVKVVDLKKKQCFFLVVFLCAFCFSWFVLDASLFFAGCFFGYSTVFALFILISHDL